MSGLWSEQDGSWKLLSPAPYGNEDELHSLVEKAPHTLPLSGSPSIAIAGREVRLGSGLADLVGIESSGRPVVIEVKLRANSEARRAVVAQVLTYAAHLHGTSVEDLEQGILATHLASRGVRSLVELARATDQSGAIDDGEFAETLSESLASGSFRVVIVLDEAPEELVELVAYLEVIADRLVVDLIAVDRYVVDGTPVLVPRRAEAERRDDDERPTTTKAREGYLVPGSQDFEDKCQEAPEENRPLLLTLLSWARQLEAEGLVTLSTFHGKQELRFTLLPRLLIEQVGLVTVWYENGHGYLQYWRSVFERRAPKALARLDERYGEGIIGQGNNGPADIDDELLRLLADAYREAAASMQQS